VLPDSAWLESRPVPGAVTAAHAGRAEVAVAVRATRWGRHATASARLVSCGPWAAFRSSSTTTSHELTVLPLPAVFDSDAAFRPSQGLVGVHRSVRPGEGSEFAGIRSFQLGDRLRRIN